MSAHFELVTAVPAGLVGLAVGSFGTLVADRVPRRESILRPASHCDSCERPLRAHENLPVVSYLVLGGRCSSCGSRIPLGVLLLELVTAAVFVGFSGRLPSLWALPAYCVLSAGLLMLSAVDFRLRRLPTPVVYWTGGLGALLLVVASAGSGDWRALVTAGIGGAACFVLFFAIFLAVPKGIGFGDVRLVAVCGLMLGWLGLKVVPLGLLLGFLLATIPAVALVVVGKANRKSQIPFGPYLAAGAILGSLFGPAIIRATGLF